MDICEIKLKGFLPSYFNLNVSPYQVKSSSSEITPIKHQIWQTKCEPTNVLCASVRGLTFCICEKTFSHNVTKCLCTTANELDHITASLTGQATENDAIQYNL